MPRYVVHVGPHKTGTTYLQVAFHAIRDELASSGIIYPPDWYPSESSPTHYRLYQLIKNQHEAALAQQFTKFNLISDKHILISAEDLSQLIPQQIELLKGLFRDNPATIVIYARSWGARVISGWKETVRHGSTETLPEFVARNLANPHRSLVNFGVVIQRYAEVFGRDSLNIVSYDEVIGERLNLRDHFLAEILGISCEVPAPRERLHVSPTSTDAEIARALNTLDPALGRRYLDARHKIDTGALHALMSAHAATLRLDESDPIFERVHADTFAAYGSLLVPPQPNGHFFTPRAILADYVAGGYLLAPGGREEIFRLRDLLQSETGEGGAGDAAAGESGSRRRQIS